LVREKLQEVENVMESEVLLVWNESMKIRESFNLKRKNIMLDEINNAISSNKYNEISKIIFKNYLLFLLK
jgi:hypothetical protein